MARPGSHAEERFLQIVSPVRLAARAQASTEAERRRRPRGPAAMHGSGPLAPMHVYMALPPPPRGRMAVPHAGAGGGTNAADTSASSPCRRVEVAPAVAQAPRSPGFRAARAPRWPNNCDTLGPERGTIAEPVMGPVDAGSIR